MDHVEYALVALMSRGNPAVVANYGNDTVSVLVNSGAGTFAPKVDYPTGSTPSSVALGDVDGDGKLDLVVANNGSSTASVLVNSGTGTFAPKVDYPTGAPRIRWRWETWTGTASSTSWWPRSVLVNSGTGTFAARVDYLTGGSPSSVALGDVDGDGNLDLVVANEYSDAVSVLVNGGTGTFATPVDYPTGTLPSSVALGDVDGDGKLDLVVANSGGNTVSVLVNSGTGTFAPKVDYPRDPCHALWRWET
ncbi:MAG: VCBS repeat-containing protein [Myxococcales bacterium]|nr:VCBS repeat-containing protein [Myxococcales bacterium]